MAIQQSPTTRRSPLTISGSKPHASGSADAPLQTTHQGPENGAAIVTRISRNLHRQLKLHCLENDMTLTSFVTRALEEHLDASRRKAVRGGRSMPAF